MPWIEQRHRKHIPYTRLEGRKVAGPRFGSREEAEMFLRLAELAGRPSKAAMKQGEFDGVLDQLLHDTALRLAEQQKNVEAELKARMDEANVFTETHVRDAEEQLRSLNSIVGWAPAG